MFVNVGSKESSDYESMAYNVTAVKEQLEVGKYKVTLETRFNDVVTKFSEQVVNLQEQAIRDCLEDAGWLPPEEIVDLRRDKMITKDMALHMLKDMNDLAESSEGKNYFYDALRDYIEDSDKITNKLRDGSEGEPKEGTLLHMVKDLPWPDGAICVVQDGDMEVKWIPSLPRGSEYYGGGQKMPDMDGCWWYASDTGKIDCSRVCSVDVRYDLPLSSDWNTAVITKEMWESAQ